MASNITEEDQQLLDMFKVLKVKPKTDSPEDLHRWLSEFGSREARQDVPSTQPITISSQQPRLSIFFGDTDSVTKGEVTYDQWKYEVKSLMIERSYRAESIIQAIRRSVRGEASRILMRLGPGVKIDEILHKFDSVYGVVESLENLLAKFYSAKQKADEDVTTWSCRLEDIISRVVEKGIIGLGDTNDMLRSMFWTGLRQDLKDISGYKFDSINDFDKLRVELRKIEQDHVGKTEDKTKLGIAKSAMDRTDYMNEIKELRGMIQSVASSVSDMGEKINELSASRSQKNPVQELKNEGQSVRPKYAQEHRQRRDVPHQNEPHVSSYSERQRQPRTRYDRQVDNRQNGGRQMSNNIPTFHGNTNYYDDGPLCFRCRQHGHFQWECRTRLDHSKHLN